MRPTGTAGTDEAMRLDSRRLDVVAALGELGQIEGDGLRGVRAVSGCEPVPIGGDGHGGGVRLETQAVSSRCCQVRSRTHRAVERSTWRKRGRGPMIESTDIIESTDTKGKRGP